MHWNKWTWRHLTLKINCANTLSCARAFITLLLKIMRFYSDIYVIFTQMHRFMFCRACVINFWNILLTKLLIVCRILSCYHLHIKTELNLVIMGTSLCLTVRDLSFSTYAEFSKKLTFLISWYAHVRLRVRE